VLPAQALQHRRQFGGQPEGMPRAVERLHGRPRPVGRQFQQRRQSGKLLPPVGQLTLERRVAAVLRVLQPAPLPRGIVRILHGEFRQGRGPSGRIGFVQSGQLPDEHAHGPAIRHDVMHGHEGHVFTVAQAEQARAQQRSGGQVKGQAGFLCGEALRLRFAFCDREAAQVGDGQQHDVRRNLRRRDAVHRRKRRAQDFVPTNDLVDGLLQGREVERPGQPHGGRHVVGRAARFPLVEEPEPLLGIRQGRGLVRAAGRDGRLRCEDFRRPVCRILNCGLVFCIRLRTTGRRQVISELPAHLPGDVRELVAL